MIICKLRKAALLVSIIFLSGCHPGYIVPRSVDVFEKKSLHQYYKTGHLAILPFDSPAMTQDLGIEAARMFQTEITKKQYMKTITFLEDSSWIKQITDSELKIKEALLAARTQNADLVLWGAFEKFIPGIATDTEVTLNVKLINSTTGHVVWWGRARETGKQGNTFLLMAKYLSPDPPDVEKLMHHAAKKIVDDMFAAQAFPKNKNFFSGLVGRILPTQKSSESSEPVPQMQETALQAEESPGTQVSGPASSLKSADESSPAREKDVIDRAIDELDAE